jgi:hypothetical protein
MSDFIPVITMGAKRVLGYGQALLKDIDPTIAARKPRGEGGKTIDTNTPTFVYGHLAIYPARILTLLGRSESEIAAIRVSESWESMFKAGAPCDDDAEGKYPSLAQVSEHFIKAHTAAIATLENSRDVDLLAIFPDPARREVFPTIGTAINFLMIAHPMVHLGQVSAWRRCYGLASAM